MTKEKLVNKLINNELNYNNTKCVDNKCYYYNMAYVLIRQTQFLNEDDKKYVLEAISESPLYNKVLTFAFSRTDTSKIIHKNIYINTKLNEIKTLINDLEVLINN